MNKYEAMNTLWALRDCTKWRLQLENLGEQGWWVTRKDETGQYRPLTGKEIEDALASG